MSSEIIVRHPVFHVETAAAVRSITVSLARSDGHHSHPRNLCDMKQTGKLNREQFALALHLIQLKLKGAELPAALTPEMVPPTMRPKPGQESAPPPPQVSQHSVPPSVPPCTA